MIQCITRSHRPVLLLPELENGNVTPLTGIVTGSCQSGAASGPVGNVIIIGTYKALLGDYRLALHQMPGLELSGSKEQLRPHSGSC